MIGTQILNTKAAFNSNQGDMSCFLDLDGFISSNTNRFLIYIICLIFSVHGKHSTEIKHFLSLELAKQQ